MLSLFGPLQGPRRVGRCPRGGALPQVAPVEAALGVPPPQRTSGEIQVRGGALAGCVPFAPAARVLSGYGGSVVSPRAGWEWAPATGRHAMEHLQAEGATGAQGHEPTPEPLAAGRAAWPLA